jgi:hypothetical protein
MLKNEISVVVKNSSDEWWTGTISNGEFLPDKQVKKLEDVGDASSYIILSKYLKRIGLDITLTKSILKKTGLENIYVLYNRLQFCGSVKEWNSYWWAKYNEKCLSCSKKCKQSIYAEVLVCKEYEKA